MEKTAAGPVKSRSSKGEAVRKAMTRRGLGIITLSMAENVRNAPILPVCASRAHLDGSVPETGPGRSDSSDCGGTNREGGAPILDTGERAEGNGISQCVEWRNTVFPIRPSFPGEDVDGARLQGA